MKEEVTKLSSLSPPLVISITCVCYTMWSAGNDWRGFRTVCMGLVLDSEKILTFLCFALSVIYGLCPISRWNNKF